MGRGWVEGGQGGQERARVGAAGVSFVSRPRGRTIKGQSTTVKAPVRGSSARGERMRSASTSSEVRCTYARGMRAASSSGSCIMLARRSHSFCSTVD